MGSEKTQSLDELPVQDLDRGSDKRTGGCAGAVHEKEGLDFPSLRRCAALLPALCPPRHRIRNIAAKREIGRETSSLKAEEQAIPVTSWAAEATR